MEPSGEAGSALVDAGKGGREPVPAAADTVGDGLPLSFSGSGAEYFRIWIVNLALTILTLGIYSAWAKVRRLKYFYQNTRLGGASFNYHGEPMAILKGRLLALGLLAAWQVAPLDRAWGVAVWAALAAVWPWIVVRSMHFKRRNSSYRNVRFRFDGQTREVYVLFALLMGISFISAWALYPQAAEGSAAPAFSKARLALGFGAGLVLLSLAPHFHFVIQQFFARHTLFGDARFKFSAGAGTFYKVYLILGLTLVTGMFVVGALVGFAIAAGRGGSSGMAMIIWVVTAFAVVLMLYGFILFIGPYFTATIQNLIWNNTTLKGHRFRSTVTTGRLFRITLANLFLIVLTMGFYRPFAVIRLLQYRVESVSLIPQGDLDSFVGAAESTVAAFGEEAADLFDIDLAL